jgi:hypothetical protein
MRLSTFTKTGAALVLALGMAAPVMLSSGPASAAPHGGAMSMHMDPMHDHGHRPPARAERRPPQPHGHYRWRAGSYAWRGNQWVWAPGIWIRF